MSTAAAPTATADAPAPKSKKKLIIILAAVLLLVLVGGVGGFLLLKKKAHADEDGDEGTHAEQMADGKPKRDPKTPPTYVPLDMFVVNLADRDAERYAQIGITLEMNDAKDSEQIKTFLPAIRNNILMVLANKGSADLLSREGKAQLAGEIQRTASRALGVDVPEPGAVVKPQKVVKAKKAEADDEADDEDKPKKKKKKVEKVEKPAPPPVLPILAVHFSNFIVQ